MRISDWSSDVCSSDLDALEADQQRQPFVGEGGNGRDRQREGDRLADGHAEPEQPEQQQQSHRRYSSPRTGGSLSGRGGDRKSTRLTPVTNAHIVCRLLLEKKITIILIYPSSILC